MQTVEDQQSSEDQQSAEPHGLRRVAKALAPTQLVHRGPTKLQVFALVGVILLALGPMVALFLVVNNDQGPVTELLDGGSPPADGAAVTATLIGVSPTTGELLARITVDPQPGLLKDGQLAEDLVLGVNDIRGEHTREFAAGEALQPVEVSLALSDGSVKRYPFDHYDATLLLTLANAVPGDDQPVPFSLVILSNVDDFEVAAAPASLDPAVAPPDQLEPGPIAAADLSVTRELTTTAYAAWMMLLMWALSVVAVAVLWAVIIWQVEVPWWGMAYFVGVLFALPQLREVLPGRPPPGTLFDFVAFYWAVAILGVGLITLLAVWIQRTRPRPADPTLEPDSGSISDPDGE